MAASFGSCTAQNTGASPLITSFRQRRLPVSIANLDNGENRQMSLTEWSLISEDREKQEVKKKKLDLMIEQVQQRYGANAIKKGQ